MGGENGSEGGRKADACGPLSEGPRVFLSRLFLEPSLFDGSVSMAPFVMGQTVKV
jgi:hypothetical protein